MIIEYWSKVKGREQGLYRKNINVGVFLLGLKKTTKSSKKSLFFIKIQKKSYNGALVALCIDQQFMFDIYRIIISNYYVIYIHNKIHLQTSFFQYDDHFLRYYIFIFIISLCYIFYRTFFVLLLFLINKSTSITIFAKVHGEIRSRRKICKGHRVSKFTEYSGLFEIICWNKFTIIFLWVFFAIFNLWRFFSIKIIFSNFDKFLLLLIFDNLNLFFFC